MMTTMTTRTKSPHPSASLMETTGTAHPALLNPLLPPLSLHLQAPPLPLLPVLVHLLPQVPLPNSPLPLPLPWE